MRLWHNDLLEVLPRQQLIAQLRECVALAKDIKEKGCVNHILVNPINSYPVSYFSKYCNNVICTMVKRGFNVSKETINKLEDYIDLYVSSDFYEDIYPWQNKDYLKICYYNLYEKFLRNGISPDEWKLIKQKCRKIL